MSTYRVVPDERRDDYRRILQYAFQFESGPELDEPTDEWPSPLFEPRAVFDGEDICAVCKLYSPEMFLHDEYTTVGGIGGVATPPERRREGHVRTMLRHTLEEYRENGVTLTVLWPFSTPFYRNLGWGVANKFGVYEIPLDQLSFARGAEGEVTRLTPEDWERLRQVETAFGEGVGLSMRRSEAWWRDRTLADWAGTGTPYVYGYERDGELCGYALYTVDTNDGDRRLKVVDLAHTDDDAFFGLLDFFSNHDSQADRVDIRRAWHRPLLDYLPDPNAAEATVHTGSMVRLTDVAAGLETYPWPAELDTRFDLQVSDSLLDANDGTFTVTVRDGAATVDPDSAADPDIAVDIATLSQLFVGTYDLAEAERFETVSVETPALRETLAEAFTSRPVCLREFF